MLKIFKNRVFQLKNQPVVLSYSSVCAKKEAEGPLGEFFDKTYNDSLMDQKSWEIAECLLQKKAVCIALEKSGLDSKDIDVAFAGDLLNQCVPSVFGLKKYNIPFLGQFGACSTMAQTLLLSSIFINSGYAENALSVTSSHFCSAEKQYRFPLEYGGQRTPCAQWTVTGSGAIILSNKKNMKSENLQYIDKVLIGAIVDFGVNDCANMGAAMAPSAAQTISLFLDSTNTSPSDYDLILTGDLGEVGSELLKKLLLKEGYDINKNHKDCGLMIYYKEKQDVHSGGSGCGCSAVTLCSVILKRMAKRELNNILFIATGALMSPTSFKQGETIPGIAHLVQIRNFDI